MTWIPGQGTKIASAAEHLSPRAWLKGLHVEPVLHQRSHPWEALASQPESKQINNNDNKISLNSDKIYRELKIMKLSTDH